MKNYSICELKNIFDIKIKENGWRNLYRQSCINYAGYVKDTKTYYSEELAGLILNEINILKNGNWNANRARKSYKVHHDTSKRIGSQSCRIEELEATEIYNLKHFLNIGEIKDYQTPLCSKKKDSLGKIDLLAYDKNKNVMRIIEFKREDSKETILRCILETYTYKRLVEYNKIKFLDDFSIPNNAQIIPSILIYSTSFAYKQYQDNKLKNIHKLIEELGIEILEVKKRSTYSIERV